MQNKEGINYSGRLFALLSAIVMSGLLMLTMSSLATAEVEAATLTVTKSVSGDSHPGGTLDYVIVIAASGSGSTNFQMTDTLPISVTYVSSSLVVSDNAFDVAEDGGVITSTAGYSINTNQSITVSFQAEVSDSTAVGSVITNTVTVEDSGNALILSSDAAVTVEQRTDPIDLFVEKTVTGGDHLPGGTIEYSIVVSNTAGSARNFVLTDTLPADLTYVPNSLVTSSGFNMAESAGVLTSSEFFLNAGLTVEASFAVTIDASTAVSTVITNTVMMQDSVNNLSLEDSVAATVITVTVPSTYYIHMPLIFKPYAAPVLNSIIAPTGLVNEWTVSWSDMHSADSRITGYQLQEATDAAFTQNVVTTDLGKVTSLDIAKALISSKTHYYRVRAIAFGSGNGTGIWSGARSVLSVYFYEETFSNTDNPTNWRIVRQDTDEVINTASVKATDPGYLDLRMESRYDYMIASDLSQLPAAPFKLTARMRLDDADPRHTGGIILNGDYDGSSTCPETDYSTCFNQYYRFLFLAGNTSSEMQVSVKRIEKHASDDNSGSGVSLGSATLSMGSTKNSDWIEWTIEADADGEMRVKRDGSVVLTVNDTTYQGNRYFGFWSSTSDTTFSNTQIDWVTVESQ
ncbi:MAG: putative repeat protein (TIGR01451 family)/fimbrial isopeptide formation D2 family protein [Cellvibrionaceae bacterium]|jgi:uncharacterized repeat protein (TIGR01451 family)/fimbrial isopeptide formation D2 family protein